MEVLATIGLVGLAGKYISERFNNNTDDKMYIQLVYFIYLSFIFTKN